MTKIGDLLGGQANELIRDNIKVGDVHIISLDKSNGITPKDGDAVRNKYFIVLGFDESGNIIGGLVINSRINHRLSAIITDYHLPITVQQCPFLKHNSFVNCSILIRANRDKFNALTYRGEISDDSLMEQIMDAVRECPTANKRILKEFGII